MTLDTPTLAALRARSDDLDAFRVLADRLQAEGDPRGELISLQLHGQPKLVERHLALHARQLLGRLFTHQSSLSLVWEAGFIRQATLTSQEGFEQRRWDGRLVAEHRGRRPFAWLVAELLKLESAALLEQLTLTLVTSPRSDALFGEALGEVARLAPPTLSRLALKRTPEAYDDRGRYGFEPSVEQEEDLDWPPYRRKVALHGRQLILEADAVSLLEHAHAVLRDGG